MRPVADTSGSRREPGATRRVMSALLGGSLAVALVTPKGFGSLLALAVLVALFTLRPRDLAALRPQDRVFLLLLICYPLLVALSMLLHGLKDPGLFDNASRFALLGIVYVALRVRAFDVNPVVSGAIVGTVLAFGASLIHLAQGSALRFGGFENPVVFAQITFFLLLIAVTPVRVPGLSELRMRQLLVVVLLMGATSLLVSQSRAALTAFAVLCIHVLFLDSRFDGSRAAKAAFVLGGIILVASLFSASEFRHLGQTAAEMRANYGRIDPLTSTGQRLALWVSSWQLILERPWFGWGVGQFRDALNSLPDAAFLTAEVRGYGHAHNDFMHMAVEQGLVSLAIFLLSLIALVLMAVREGFDGAARHLLIGAIAAWLFFALTQTQFAHQKTAMMFALLLVLGFSAGMNHSFGPLERDDT